MKRDVLIRIRATPAQRALLDRAAGILHQSPSSFILDSACQAAENVITERQEFSLSDEQYAEFVSMLDAPDTVNVARDKLLARKVRWE